MRENQSDAAAYTQGVYFPGKKKILTKKRWYYSKKEGKGVSVCC
ncbi:MAG: hypothetical protein WA667_09725 [Candidatus Nitrosopolaris sp.]